MAIKGYKITQEVKDRLKKARKAIKKKIKNPNALKPNDQKYRKHKKNFRKNHVSYRNYCRKKNYSKSRPTIRKNRPWEEWEINAIFHQDNWTDMQMSINLNRSVQAIQQKRYLSIKTEKGEVNA